MIYTWIHLEFRGVLGSSDDLKQAKNGERRRFQVPIENITQGINQNHDKSCHSIV